MNQSNIKVTKQKAYKVNMNVCCIEYFNILMRTYGRIQNNCGDIGDSNLT